MIIIYLQGLLKNLPRDFIDIQDSSFIENNNFIENFTSSPENLIEKITPGRKRLLNKSKKNEIEWNFNQDIYEDIQLVNGTKVFHQKYGHGNIIDIDGDVADVKFDKSSQKKIFIKYLKPTI